MRRRKEAKMRRLGPLRLCALILLAVSPGFALTITQAEYFLDNDPGLGNGTAFTFSGTDSASAAFVVPTAGSLPPGIHKIYVRFRDDEGVWSPAAGRYYFIFTPWTSDLQTPAISQLEYYFDNLAPTVIDV